MQDLDTRNAILRLRAEGHEVRTIARAMNLSRSTVRRMLEAGTAEAPALERQERTEPHEAMIGELHATTEAHDAGP